MDDIIPLAAIFFIFGIPMVKIITGHWQKMAEMKLRLLQQTDENVMEEIRQIKSQITDLRDTTTRYDMSFDTALQRLESRMGQMEQRLTAVEREESASSRAV